MTFQHNLPIFFVEPSDTKAALAIFCMDSTNITAKLHVAKMKVNIIASKRGLIRVFRNLRHIGHTFNNPVNQPQTMLIKGSQFERFVSF